MKKPPKLNYQASLRRWAEDETGFALCDWADEKERDLIVAQAVARFGPDVQWGPRPGVDGLDPPAPTEKKSA